MFYYLIVFCFLSLLMSSKQHYNFTTYEVLAGYFTLYCLELNIKLNAVEGCEAREINYPNSRCQLHNHILSLVSPREPSNMESLSLCSSSPLCPVIKAMIQWCLQHLSWVKHEWIFRNTWTMQLQISRSNNTIWCESYTAPYYVKQKSLWHDQSSY